MNVAADTRGHFAGGFAKLASSFEALVITNGFANSK